MGNLGSMDFLSMKMSKLSLTIYLCISFLLMDHRTVESCMSKSAPTPSEPTTTVVPLLTEGLGNHNRDQEAPGVWKTGGDRSLSHSHHHHSSGSHSADKNPSSQQAEELLQHPFSQQSVSPVNGHNEGLLLRALPTQDRGISERQRGSSFLSQHNYDEISSPAQDIPLLRVSSFTDDFQHNNNNDKNQLMNLVLFSNKAVQCNDRSTAGYYIRKSADRNSKLWIVFLEGGGFCFDGRSCQNRYRYSESYMSSSSWPLKKYVNGILSPDPSENPYWWNANHVFVPYCSSDVWSGMAKAGENGSEFAFMGSLIVDEVMKSLVKNEGLKASSSVLLAGSSAGGTGALINLDRVDSLLKEEFGEPKNGVSRVKGICDSGWFIDGLLSFKNKTDCTDPVSCPPEISLKRGVNLWKARLPGKCLNEYPNDPRSCFFGYKTYRTLEAPLFVVQWVFDEVQSLANNVPRPATKKDEWDYIYKLGVAVKKSLANVTAAFVPSCVAHTILIDRDWKHSVVNSVSLPRALKCWESDGIIEESNDVPWSQTYWEDREESSPTKRTRNTIRSNNRIITSSSTHLEQSDFPEVVSSNDSSHRNRRRHQDRSKKGRRKNRRKKNRLDKFPRSQNNDRRNLTLVLDPSIKEIPLNSTRRRQRKRHHGRPNDHHLNRSGNRTNNHKSNKSVRHANSKNIPNSTSSNNYNNNNSRAGRRSDDSGHNDHVTSNNQVRSRKRQQQSQSQSQNHRWFPMCGVDKTGENPRLIHRHIDKCLWPQCNKTCPKLINPVTMEEVDFKDMLKAFGLDMGNTAVALGMDMDTLNNIDRQVLLNMLTQNV